MRRSWPFIFSYYLRPMVAAMTLLSLPSAFAFAQTPAPDPGLPLPPAVVSSDEQPGAVLAFPIFTSLATAPQLQNTRFSLTNVDAERNLFVHLFFVAETGAVADSFVCLRAQGTLIFLASDLDPGVTGYLLAVAVDAAGCPTNRNVLIGDEYVKLRSGHAANLGAEAFAALPGWQACASGAPAATINFDGVRYSMAARVVASNYIPSFADGNNTLFVFNRLGGDLRVRAATIGTFFGFLYDDAENAITFISEANSSQFRAFVFPLLCAPPRQCFFRTFIPSERSGWTKMLTLTDTALFGAAINFNPNVGTQVKAFNQGSNFHRLTLTNAASITIPITPPSC